MAEDQEINKATPKVNLSGNEEYPANDSGNDRKVNTDSIANYSISKLFSKTSQGSLADNDKFSINGAATVLWSTIKSYMEMFSNKVNLFSASTETPSGVPTIQQTANEEFTANIKALQTEISRIATASGTVYADPTPVSITTTESELDISIQSDSNNTDIIEFDATLNRITLKRFGRYQFYTNIELRNTSLAAEHTLIIRTRNATGGAIITERTVTVSKNIIKSDAALVQVDVPEGSEPITLYISVQSDDNTSLSLESLITTLSAAGVQGLDNDVNVKITANDTTAGYLNDKLVVGGEFTKEVTSPSGNETLLLKLTGWFYNAARTFKAIFNFESLTADKTITWQDKNITVAGLDDLQTSLQLQFDTSITASDPGAGKFRINADKTELYISDTEYDNGNIGDFLNALSADTIIGMKAIGNRLKWANYKVTSVTNNTGWWTIVMTVENKGTDFAASDIVGVSLLGVGGGGIESNSLPFSEIISINEALQHVDGVTTQTGVYNFTKGSGNFINGVETRLIETDGINPINFVNSGIDFIVLKNDYISLLQSKYLLMISCLPNGAYGVILSNTVNLEQLTAPSITLVAGDSQVEINISSIDINSDTIILQRSVDQLNWVDVEEYTSPDNSVIDLSLTNDVIYYYRCKVIDSQNNYFDSILTYDNATPSVSASFEPETVSLLNAMTTLPDSSRENLINTTILNLKNDGIWSKLHYLYIFAAHTNVNSEALIDWINPLVSASAVNSPTFTIDRGITPDGVSSYVKSSKSNLGSVNSVSYGYYTRNGVVMTMGSYDGANRLHSIVLNANQVFAVNSTAQTSDIPALQTPGLIIFSRTESSNAKYSINGSAFTNIALPVTSLCQSETYIGARNNNGTADVFSTDEFSMAFVADGLTDTESANLFTIIENYMDAVGAGVVA